MLKMLMRFVTSAQQISTITYTPGNTGNGYVSAEGADDSAPDETWTITFTSSTEFTATGSVSGLQTATGTVGTEYTSDGDELTLTMIAGTVAWDTGDSLTMVVEEGLGTEKWAIDQYIDSDVDGTPDKQLIMHGPGSSGLDAIYAGIQTWRDDGLGFYGWTLAGLTGYNGGVSFANQPGIPSSPPKSLFQDRESPFWVIANGRRILMCYEVNTVYEWVHFGYLLPYGYPHENPYPYLVGGTCPDERDVTDQDNRHTAFWSHCSHINVTDQNAGKVWDGSWFSMQNRFTSSTNIYDQYGNYSVFRSWPYTIGHRHNDSGTTGDQRLMTALRRNYDGTYPLLPIVVWKSTVTKRTVGQIQGLYAIPGDNTNPGDVFTVSGITYVVLPNTYLRSNQSWAALKLE
jgi:hypothetical protein